MFRLILAGVLKEDVENCCHWLLEKGTKSGEMQSLFDIHGRTMTIKVIPVAGKAIPFNTVADGIVFICKHGEDTKELEETHKMFADMPIKYILYDGTGPQHEYEAKWGVKGVNKSDPIAFADMLITANNDLVKTLADVFKSFDTDKSGFIDLKEIGAAAKELGVDMSEKEVQKMMKTLDTNKDGKISLEEFIEWWKTGRKGTKGKIGSVIEKLISKNPIFQKFLGGAKPAGSDAELMTGSFGLHVNKVKEPGVLISLTFMTKGKALENEVAEFNKAIPLKHGLPFFGISFGVKNPENAHEMLQNVAGAAITMAQAVIPNAEMIFSNLDFKYGKSTGKTVLGVVPSEAGEMMIGQFLPMIGPISAALAPNQMLDSSLAFTTDLARLVNETKPFYELLMEGVALEVKSQFDPKCQDMVTELSKNIVHMFGLPPSVIDQNIAVSGMFNKFVKSGNGELDFEIDEPLKEMIKTQLAATPVAAPLGSLKGMFAPQAKEMLGQIPIAEMAHMFFKDEVTSIEFFICMPEMVGIKFRMLLPGLGELISL